MQYRTWGAVKAVSYGDSTTLSASYNSRLLPTDFSITNTLTKHYDYNADGRLRYSRNNSGDRFDRAYTYDHLGRTTLASNLAFDISQTVDINHPEHAREAMTEVEDDFAGQQIGQWMPDATHRKLSMKDLKQKIFGLLCDK